MALSDTLPPASYLRGGKTVFTFNITQKTVTDPMTSKSRTQYEYDEAEVEGKPTRGKIIAAMVKAKYSVDDQIALIANKDLDAAHKKEFVDFQATRKAIKDAVTALGN